ncbi:MAG: hypothetical protein IT266_03685 [Saprospiraceae bacterium]|nr:hypothetical protein [Saprospiraceae bacterium]
MPDKTNILYLLWWHLNEFQWFAIPGAGVFRGTGQPTTVDHIRGMIFPANITLSLGEEDEALAFDQIQHWHDAFGYEEPELGGKLLALGAAARKALETFNAFDLPPFGTLHQTGDRLSFQQGSTNLHREFYGMGALPVKAISHGVYQKPEAIAPVVSVPSGVSREMRRARNMALASLLVLLGALVLFLCLRSCDRPPPPIGKDLQVTDSVPSPEPKDAGIAPVSDTVLMEDTGSAVVRESGEVVIEDSTVDSLSATVQHHSCIIIVGSFLRPQNADHMARRLAAANYAVHTETFGRFNRVGVVFDCVERDLGEMLATLREQVDAGAWVLKY